MEEKQFEKETKEFKEAQASHRSELNQRDRQAHSEGHAWTYDHKTGTLKDRRKK